MNTAKNLKQGKEKAKTYECTYVAIKLSQYAVVPMSPYHRRETMRTDHRVD